MDGIYLRRNWGGEYENVAVLVAIAVNEDGFREVLGAAEGMKEDKASWVSTKALYYTTDISLPFFKYRRRKNVPAFEKAGTSRSADIEI